MREGFDGDYKGLRVIPYTRTRQAPLSDPVYERFAELVFGGSSLQDAYRETHDCAAMSRDTIRQRANYLGRHPEIVRRVSQLRQPILNKARRKFEYTLDQAIEECDQAHLLAELQQSPEKMLKAVELKAKLMKMLVAVSETRASPLEGLSSEELVGLLAFAKEMKLREAKTVVLSGGEFVKDGVDGVRVGGVKAVRLVGAELSEVGTRVGGAA
jgi:hypothetical protein